ncbi:MAG TPA: IclR family transcriptional regulator [Nocardioidaceae bacterium]|nr:IclR family transcriptional regulator [Nocardioidaceae bacterium]
MGCAGGYRHRSRVPGLAGRGLRARSRAGRRRRMDGEMSQTPGPRSRSRTAIGKVTAVAEALTSDHSISGISRRTGLPVSTVHRILQELSEVGWVRTDGDHGYVLGSRLLSLAGQAADGDTVARIARPILHKLSEQTGYAAHFAVRSGDEAVYVDKVEGRRGYHMRSRIGLALPLHCSGIGKAVLANLSAEEVRAIMTRAGMPARTPKTVTDPDQLLAHLEGVRRQGCAIDDEENEANIRCVAAAVTDHRGITIGGLSVSGLAFELDKERTEQLMPVVRRAAVAVTASLGGPERRQSVAGAGSHNHGR